MFNENGVTNLTLIVVNDVPLPLDSANYCLCLLVSVGVAQIKQ